MHFSKRRLVPCIRLVSPLPGHRSSTPRPPCSIPFADASILLRFDSAGDGEDHLDMHEGPQPPTPASSTAMVWSLGEAGASCAALIERRLHHVLHHHRLGRPCSPEIQRSASLCCWLSDG